MLVLKSLSGEGLFLSFSVENILLWSVQNLFCTGAHVVCSPTAAIASFDLSVREDVSHCEDSFVSGSFCRQPKTPSNWFSQLTLLLLLCKRLERKMFPRVVFILKTSGYLMSQLFPPFLSFAPCLQFLEHHERVQVLKES